MSILRTSSRTFVLVSILGIVACGGDDTPAVDSNEPDPVDPDPCLLRFDTEPLRWSAVGVMYSADRQIEFSNAGDENCRFSLAVEGDGFATEFPATFTVEPDGTRTVAVTWTPTAVGTATGRLLVTGDEADEEIPLEGEAVAGCLSFSPEAVDFGEAAPGCGTREAEVVIENGCSHAVLGGSFEFESGEANSPEAAFQIHQYPASVLAPGPTSMTLVYRPLDVGEDDDVLTFVEETGAATSVALHGVGRLAARQTDIFEQPVTSRTDVLFVVDDSPAMAPYAAKLQAFAELLAAHARENDVIARIGVTTTSRTATTDCAGSGADGRLVPFDGSSPRWLATDSDLPTTAFADLLDVGTCSEAPNEGLAAAVRAVTDPLVSDADDPLHPEPDDGNLGFRRDANLSVMFASTSDDVSAESVDDIQAALDSAGSPGADAPPRAHALVAPAGGCDAATAGARYATLVSRTGGQIASICDPLSTWKDELLSTGRDAMLRRPYSPIFELSDVPKDADGDGSVLDDLTVEVNGEEVAAVSVDDEVRWTYDAEANAVVFEPGHIPAEGSQVEITYFQDCR